jgi:hypothetical protein
MPYTADPDRYDQMRYRRCGHSGLKLPEISLGLWHNFGGDQPGLPAFGAQDEGKLGRRRRLARPLEACEQDHAELAQLQLRRALAHQARQLLVDDLHDLLARRQALEDVLAEGALAHVRDEVTDDCEVDVRLEQRQADLAHGARNRLVVEPALLAQVAENPLQLVGKRVEHDRAS